MCSSVSRLLRRPATLIPPRSDWTFLTNHAHVLLCVAGEPSIKMRDVAAQVGITERAVQRIVADLVEGGYLETERVGRCNHYRVCEDMPLRHAVEQHQAVSALLSITRGQRTRRVSRAK